MKGTRLRFFVLVVREDEVHATAVDVDGVPEDAATGTEKKLRG
jgi:hypothetical protein